MKVKSDLLCTHTLLSKGFKAQEKVQNIYTVLFPLKDLAMLAQGRPFPTQALFSKGPKCEHHAALNNC